MMIRKPHFLMLAHKELCNGQERFLLFGVLYYFVGDAFFVWIVTF